MASAAAEAVGWIGLGRIGRPMAARVAAAGPGLTLWARRPEVARAAVADDAALAGAAWADDAEALAQRCSIVCTVVGGPADVQALHARLMPHARPGTLFIDFTTAAPSTAAAAAALAQRLGLQVLDVPVTGGVAGAQRGTLTGFVGGDPAALERARPLLSAMCARLVPCGGPGAGYRVKLVNQTLVAGVLMGLADGARLARAGGLDTAQLHGALAGGTAASALLEAYWPRMCSGDGAVSFTLALMQKDLRLAREEAEALDVPAPMLDAALVAVQAAIDRDGPQAGVQRLAA